MFVGSEGLLGVVTKAVLRLVPHPEARAMLTATFPDFERAAEAHGVILRALGDSLTTSPPLVATEADIDAIVEAYGVALDATLAEAWREAWWDR